MRSDKRVRRSPSQQHLFSMQHPQLQVQRWIRQHVKCLCVILSFRAAGFKFETTRTAVQFVPTAAVNSPVPYGVEVPSDLTAASRILRPQVATLGEELFFCATRATCRGDAESLTVFNLFVGTGWVCWLVCHYCKASMAFKALVVVGHIRPVRFIPLTFVGLGRHPHHVHGQPGRGFQAAFGSPPAEETGGGEALVRGPRVIVPLCLVHRAGLALGNQALVIYGRILNYRQVLGISNVRAPKLFQQ